MGKFLKRYIFLAILSMLLIACDNSKSENSVSSSSQNEMMNEDGLDYMAVELEIANQEKLVNDLGILMFTATQNSLAIDDSHAKNQQDYTQLMCENKFEQVKLEAQRLEPLLINALEKINQLIDVILELGNENDENLLIRLNHVKTQLEGFNIDDLLAKIADKCNSLP